MVQKSISTAREAGMKAIRFFVLGGNTPAENLYLELGFQYMKNARMYYEYTGWTAFRLYEYVL